MQAVFFDSWSSIGRTLLTGIFAYGLLVVFLRISGKRTLAKMNAFDFVVTVALGSTLSATIISHDVPLVDGIAALAVLIAMQYVVATFSTRATWFRNLVKSRPHALLRDGRYLDDAVRSERVTHEEILAAIRNSGNLDVADIAVVVLETDGTFSVIPRSDNPPKEPSTTTVT